MEIVANNTPMIQFISAFTSVMTSNQSLSF